MRNKAKDNSRQAASRQPLSAELTPTGPASELPSQQRMEVSRLSDFYQGHDPCQKFDFDRTLSIFLSFLFGAALEHNAIM